MSAKRGQEAFHSSSRRLRPCILCDGDGDGDGRALHARKRESSRPAKSQAAGTRVRHQRHHIQSSERRCGHPVPGTVQTITAALATAPRAGLDYARRTKTVISTLPIEYAGRRGRARGSRWPTVAERGVPICQVDVGEGGTRGAALLGDCIAAWGVARPGLCRGLLLRDGRRAQRTPNAGEAAVVMQCRP